MPTTATSSIFLLLLLSFTLRPLSSTSTLHHRRILHQPFLPQDSPPPIPSPPSPPKYPFSGAAPENSPFFPFYHSSPPPPSPASFASFPANISSLTVPHPSKQSSSFPKLIAAAVAAVIAAVAVVSLAVFLHLRSRTRTHGSSPVDKAKTQRSDNSTTVSYNQTPSTHHIPELQRPSQTSSEFLYLGTMVNSHAAGGAAAFNGSNATRTNCTSAADSRKLESPELRPLPPLNTQLSFQQNFRNNADVVSSKDDESEVFYSPKGSINGRESSIGTGSASRRGFAAVEVENFNGSTSNSSSTYSSSAPGSGSGSPVRSLSSSLSPVNNCSPRSSMPKSPDLIEIQTIAPLPPQMPSKQELQESASPSPPSTSSPERYSRRSEDSSPRSSNVTDRNMESPMRHSSFVQHNPTLPTEIQGLVFPESASPLLPSSLFPERYSRKSEESSPRISNVSEQNVESPMRHSSSVQHNPTTPTEIPGLVFLESASPLPPSLLSPGRHSRRNDESSPRNSNASNHNVESPVRISGSVQHSTIVIQTQSEIRGPTESELRICPSSLSPERYSRRGEESSPRFSNASNQNIESPVRMSSPVEPNTTEIQGLVFSLFPSPLPPSSSTPLTHLRSEETSPRTSNASNQNVESPVRVSSPVEPNTTEIQGLVFSLVPSPLPPSSSTPLTHLRSEETSPRTSNASNQNVESPVRLSSPVEPNTTEIQGLVFSLVPSPLPPSSSTPLTHSRSEETSPRTSNASNQNVEYPVSISCPDQHNNTDMPTSSEMQNLVFDESTLALPPSATSSEKYLSRSEESSLRSSNVSDQNVESPVKINSTIIPTPTEMQSLLLEESVSPLPPTALSPEKCLSRSGESSPRGSNVSDQKVESPVRISSAVLPTPPEMQGLLLQESSSLLPSSALSEENLLSRSEELSEENLLSRSEELSEENLLSRSEESSPRSLNVSDHNVESSVRTSSPVIPTPPEMQDLLLQESALSLEKCLSRSEESSPRSSNVSEQHEESPVIIDSSDQHNSAFLPTPPEMHDLQLQEPAPSLPPIALSPERYSSTSEESSPRILTDSDPNVEFPVRVSSPVPDNATVNPTSPKIESLVSLQSASPLPMSSSSPERYSGIIEETSPRISIVSDQNVESEVRISSPVEHKSPSPPVSSRSSSPERCSRKSEELSARILNDSVQSVHNNVSVIPPPAPPPVSVPPPPPPPLPPRSKVLESPRTPTPPAKKPPSEPPALITPLRPIGVESPTLISPLELPSIASQTVKKDEDTESLNKETEFCGEEVQRHGESTPKPKLKPLHWDKVRASSDREMVWDQLKSSSFKLNEEMIETLFVVNNAQSNPKETTRWQVLPTPGQDNGNRVLDPKKAQNIAILLRALHVTVDEVCEGLLEGNADILGTELLESLLKMAPTKEEERKLKEYKDDSPVKLGAAEKFLKAVVDIPYAFKRVDAMLYVSNFDSEVEYLRKSFATLEAACEELRTSRLFLKLLEAVLKTGNRMNVGTNRGDAHAFKLDTLLKLVDVKGADGKTTLLHFVVQEIIRTEGARLSGGTPYETSSTNDDAKCRKLGLQVVSALSSELSSVKKAAVMDAEVLSSDVSKLSKGIENIKEIVRLSETVPLDENKFSETMNRFMERAEEEIFRIQAQESVGLTLVKEITEYFHGNSAVEEAHPFRIFMVVRDFLTILDRVCKEVGMINERTIVSSAHKFPVPVNPMLQPGFHKRQHTSSDDETFPLNI